MFETELPKVVVHVGSSITQAGFSDDIFPRFINQTTSVAKSCQKNDSKSTVQVSPIINGIISDWEVMEQVWSSIFYSELRVDPSQHLVFISEPPLNPKSTRERTTQMMFETFKVEGLYVGIGPVYSLFYNRKTTGIVVDSGYEITTITPIYEGYALPHAIRSFPLGGKNVDSALYSYLTISGYNFGTQLEKDIISDIKEKICFLQGPWNQERIRSFKTLIYTLPNGLEIEIGKEAYESTEVLFDPKRFISENAPLSIQETIIQVLKVCDGDIRKDLGTNTIVSGGNCSFDNFAEKLQYELSKIESNWYRINITGHEYGKYAAWLGARFTVSLPHFDTMWIRKDEYLEKGPMIVHRKCF